MLFNMFHSEVSYTVIVRRCTCITSIRGVFEKISR